MSNEVTDEEIISKSLLLHPDCTFGEVKPGMSGWFTMTRCVNLWRNEECFLAGDPCKHTVEGYPGYGKHWPEEGIDE